MRPMKRAALFFAITLASCATTPGEAGPTARLGQVATVDGVRVRPLSVVEDSRCPARVQCVWAGRLHILAEIQYRGGSEELRREMTLGQAVALPEGTLTLAAALPEPVAGQAIDPRAYRLTFTLTAP